MSATEKMCAMLDERGISYINVESTDGSYWGIRWFVGDNISAEWRENGERHELLAVNITPEQAIAATLGANASSVDNALDLLDEMNEQGCIEYGGYSQLHDAIVATLGDDGYEAKMDALLCRLTNGKWSKSRAYDLDFMVSCVEEEFEALYSEEQFVAPASGALTAEQVRESIERHFGKVAVLDDGKPVEWRDDWVCKVGIDYKGIADELNAALGGGECRIAASSTDGLTSDEPKQWFELSCGHVFKLYGLGIPVACPVCGKAVKR